MDRYVLVHTENPSKLKVLLTLIKSHPEFSGCHLFLNSKKYIPWEIQELNGIITSFRTYRAYPTDKNEVDSIVEMINQVRDGEVFIVDENCLEISELLEDVRYDFLLCEKSKLSSLNLDTKYSSLKWFLIDLLSQKNNSKINLTDESEDCKRYLKKISNPLFFEKIIYIDGGMGDHVMSLPLINRISNEVYVCCKYPQVFSGLNFKGSVYWHDELFGGYSRFVYSFGSSNNSETIVDAFFDMYGIKRLETDALRYLGNRVKIDINTSDKKIAIISTSASKHDGKHSNKNWVSIRWMKLVNELKLRGFYVVQAGSEPDDQIPNVDLKFLDKPLENLAWLIEQSDLWISVDTFLHHFAASIKPSIGICLTPFYNDHAKHPGVTYIEKDCGKNYHDRRWWLDWQQPERKECMELISLNDVISATPIIKKLVNKEEATGVEKVYSREDFLNKLSSKLPKTPVCVEIGVLTGDFSELILEKLNPEKLYLIDPWEIGFDKNSDQKFYTESLPNVPTAYSTQNDLDIVKDKFSQEIKRERVILKKGFSYDEVQSFPDDYFDFVYIDSCHLYESVKADLEDYFPKLKPGGLICGHDYFDFDNFGVILAVDEFVKDNDCDFILLNQNGFDWALQKKKYRLNSIEEFNTVFPDNKPFVEFVIPTFDRIGPLRCLLSSLLCQTDMDWSAHVLIDDSDNKEIKDLVESFNTKKIYYTRLGQRYNDWGHTPREIGKQLSIAKYVIMTGDDNYYTPNFIEELKSASDKNPGLIYFDMVHSHKNYSYFVCEPTNCGIDMGAFATRRDLAQKLRLNTENYMADGEFIEDFGKKFPMEKMHKINKVLFVHN